MKEIRVGIVGLGLRGKLMTKLASDMVDGLRVTAVCDAVPEKFTEPVPVESFGVFGVSGGSNTSIKGLYPDLKFFTDAEEMYDSGLCDAVIIETPAYHHVHFCKEALKRDLHVFGEIPPVADLYEAKELYDAVMASKGMFFVGANPSRSGYARGMKDFQQAGLLGEIFYMEAEYIHDLRHLWKVSPWRQKAENTPIKYCTHSLGPLLSLIDSDLRQVYCTGSGSRIADHECNDLMAAQFQTDDKVIVRLMVSFVNANRHGMHSYRVFGSHGSFERFSERGKEPAKVFFNSDKLYGLHEVAKLSVDKEPWEYRLRPDILNSGHGGTDYDLLSVFRDALNTEEKISPISIKDGLRMTLPGIYADASARQGGKVMRIHYPWDADFDPAELDNI